MIQTHDGLLETQTLRVRGIRIRYCKSGQGDPLILLHGFPETMQTWRQNVPALAEHFEVHAFDWPGMGRSDRPHPWHYNPRGFADFLEAFMDEIGVSRADVIAGGMSVPAALIFALQHPERVDRLVVFDGPALFRPGLMGWSMRALMNPGPGDLLMFAFPRTGLRLALQRGFHGSVRLPREVYEDYKHQIEDVDTRQAVLQFHRTMQDELEWIALNVSRLEAPLMIVWGDRDTLIDRMMGQDLQTLVPRSRLEIIHRCGHFPNEEAAGEFNRLVYEFLTEEAYRRERVH